MATHSKSRWLLGAAIALVVAASTATAFGYWRSSGSGSGNANVSTAVASLTIAPGSAGADLYPGGSGSVALVVSNPNPSSAHLPSLVLDTSRGSSGFDVDSGHSACTTPALSFTSQNNGGQGWTVPAKVGSTNGTLSLTFPSAVTMGSTADNACQGATFTVYLKSGG